ncbi:MAG: acyl-CoA thioesterase domain-containing protein [Ilumatobacteraceae bacterium]
MFALSPHGTDVHVGTGPQYPWGGLYGGQIVAQALRASAISVDPELEPHSIRAYFIRRGDHTEPVRYEVDRIRNGRSFATRRVVARQAVGAILNAESSFQRPERAAAVQTLTMPEVPASGDLEEDSWTTTFSRVMVPTERVTGVPRDGAGRAVAWMRVNDDLGDPADAESQLLHRCWLAYLSDDMPTDSVIRAHPVADDAEARAGLFCASLDHTIWFHRPLRADRWHLYDFSCHHYVGGRGLSVGHVFADDGTHVATVAQEVLVRDARDRE